MIRFGYGTSSLLLLCGFTALAANPPCQTFGSAERIGSLDSEAVPESSGLALSRANADLLWTHNDSGDGAFVYAFGLDGKAQGRLQLEGVTATDWEAMGIGPCGTATCLYMGDIGDNLAQRSSVKIWRFIEPSPPGAEGQQLVVAQGLDVFYPNAPLDAEGLAVDPLTGDLLLVEKSFSHFFSVFRVPASAWDQDQDWVLAEELDRLALEGGSEAIMITQADIDPTGAELFLGTYGAGYRYEVLRRDGLITGLGPARSGPIYGEGQCEAGSYGPDGLSLYFSCEAIPTPLAKANCETPWPPLLPPAKPLPEPQADSCNCRQQSPLSLWYLLLAWSVIRILRLRRERAKAHQVVRLITAEE